MNALLQCTLGVVLLLFVMTPVTQTQDYRCTKEYKYWGTEVYTVYQRQRYTVSCGWVGTQRCDRYRQAPSKAYQTRLWTSYRRECCSGWREDRFGKCSIRGGERPTTDGVLEEVLAVLAPAAKEGVVARGEGETIPGEAWTPFEEEDGNDDGDDGDLEDGGSEGLAPPSPSLPSSLPAPAVPSAPTAASLSASLSASTSASTSASLSASAPAKKSSYVSNREIYELEKERLEIERERLQVARDHLQVAQQLNVNLQMILALACQQSGIMFATEGSS